MGWGLLGKDRAFAKVGKGFAKGVGSLLNGCGFGKKVGVLLKGWEFAKGVWFF